MEEFNLEAMSAEELDALLKAVEAKLQQLAGEGGEEREEDPDADPELVEKLPEDIDELEKIVEAAEGRKASIRETAEKRSRLISRIAAGETGKTIRKFEEPAKEETKMFELDSKEYRSAFLKKLQGKPLTAEERTAVTATAAIPT